MRSAGREELEKFKHKHAAAKKPLSVWLALVEREVWRRPQDIKNLYRSVDFLSGNRVVFNIGGNNFRLAVVVTKS